MPPPEPKIPPTRDAMATTSVGLKFWIPSPVNTFAL
jgi:hypothetical protein